MTFGDILVMVLAVNICALSPFLAGGGGGGIQISVGCVIKE